MAGDTYPPVSNQSSGAASGTLWVDSPTKESVTPQWPLSPLQPRFHTNFENSHITQHSDSSDSSIPLPDFDPSMFRRLSDDEDLQTLLPSGDSERPQRRHRRAGRNVNRFSTASNRLSIASSQLGLASSNLRTGGKRLSAFTERQIRQLESIIGNAIKQAFEENPLEFARRALGESAFDRVPEPDLREEDFIKHSPMHFEGDAYQRRISKPHDSLQRVSSSEKRFEEADLLVEKHVKIPDGGARAWSVAIGGFLTYFATFGLLNSFGTFQTYYSLELLRGTAQSTIAWIGSIQLFLLFIGGMVVGPAFDKYGARRIMIPGTIIYVVSLMLTSLCTKYYQLILAQGVLYGIGDSMLFYPTISAISHWFDRKRGLALGIAVSGSSIGGICWPIMLERVFPILGFPWTTRIAGFMCLALLVPSCWLIKERKGVQAHGEPPAMNKVFKDMAKEKSYLILTAAFFFVFWGMFLPFYYIPTYGLEHGMSNSMANYTLAFLNAGSFVGRVGSGIIADKLGSLNITFFCATSAGIVLMFLHLIKSSASIIAFAALYGALSGGLISLQSACVAQMTKDLGAIGIRIGVLMAVCSFGVLTGAPIGGALITKGWGAFIDFAGIILLFGSALMALARFVGRPKLFSIF